MKKLFSYLTATTILFISLSSIASADLGPKPSVDIDITYNHQAISDPTFTAKMLGCQPENITQSKGEYDTTKKCYWYPPRLAWGGQCANSQCHFGYMPPMEFKLEIFVPSINKTFTTNAISRANFNSHYLAELSPDGSAKITETTTALSSDQISSFIKAFLLTITLELLTTLIFISWRKLPKKILTHVLLANIISLPIVWFVFPAIILSIPAIIIISEIFAVLFETYFVYRLNKHILSFKQSLALNVINNLASLILGGLALLFI